LNVKKIQCGGNHSFAVTIDEKIYSWGNNEFGQCGVSSKYKNNLFEPILLDFKFDEIPLHFNID
jgi:alpha-tubulin suppressor-like RCC1 family protein